MIAIDEGGNMAGKERPVGNGMALLVAAYRKHFRISENLDYYGEKDFIRAERKFIELALKNAGVSPLIQTPGYCITNGNIF